MEELKGFSSKKIIRLKVNGEINELAIEPWRTLLEVLRDSLGLTGTKKGCDLGTCGACTVLIDGKPMLSCLLLAIEVQDREILTIEGVAKGGHLHPLQETFMNHGAIQCGFCSPGMILTAKALLEENPEPSEEGVRKGISGNICRCTGYTKIIEAILAAGSRAR
jgi:carbon-monoxide dehydrogenase small subunit